MSERQDIVTDEVRKRAQSLSKKLSVSQFALEFEERWVANLPGLPYKIAVAKKEYDFENLTEESRKTFDELERVKHEYCFSRASASDVKSAWLAHVSACRVERKTSEVADEEMPKETKKETKKDTLTLDLFSQGTQTVENRSESFAQTRDALADASSAENGSQPDSEPAAGYPETAEDASEVVGEPQARVATIFVGEAETSASVEVETDDDSSEEEVRALREAAQSAEDFARVVETSDAEQSALFEGARVERVERARIYTDEQLIDAAFEYHRAKELKKKTYPLAEWAVQCGEAVGFTYVRTEKFPMQRRFGAHQSDAVATKPVIVFKKERD